MTRKDYVRIARALAIAKPHDNARAEEWCAWNRALWEIGSELAEDNPRFDRDRFERACRGEEGGANG